MSTALPYTDEYFMRQALDEQPWPTKRAKYHRCSRVCRGQIIARAHNEVERLSDPTAHAEVLAVTAATEYMGSKFLPDCQLYRDSGALRVCAGALFWARLGEIIYGAGEEKFGYRHYAPDLFPRRAKIRGGLLADEARELMQRFFAARR